MNKKIFGKMNLEMNTLRKNNNYKIIEQRETEFKKYLKTTNGINSVLEFGANIGLNLSILKSMIEGLSLHAVEINQLCDKGP